MKKKILLILILIALFPSENILAKKTSKRYSAEKTLPFSAVFKGKSTFKELLWIAKKENWRKLPIGERVMAVALHLVDTPYKNYTLEIDDYVEAPSANLKAMDCWTFFEISLGFARMLKIKKENYTPEDLLAMIEMERYRNGKCTGAYISRIHHLEELFHDNERRGLVRNITRKFRAAKRLRRTIKEMTNGWRQYRYLVKNPSLRASIKRMEKKVSKLPVYHIPKKKVSKMERYLKNGDIIATTTRGNGGYTSHVGLAWKDPDGVLRFVHASKNYGRCLVDSRLSDYLNTYSSHIGIVVARPNDVPLKDIKLRSFSRVASHKKTEKVYRGRSSDLIP